MKKTISMLLIVCAFFSIYTSNCYAYSWDPPPATYFDTPEEYRAYEDEHPRKCGIRWEMFSVLGSYVPHVAYAKYGENKAYIVYEYDAGQRTYTLFTTDLTLTYPLNKDDKPYPYTPSDEEWADKVAYWDKYCSQIEQYTTKEYNDIYNNQPSADWPLCNWVDSDSVSDPDLTNYVDDYDNDKYNRHVSDGIALVNDNLVFNYGVKGMMSIDWIHNGVLYTLVGSDKEPAQDGSDSVFGEKDIPIIRRLTNRDTCEDALNELMAQVSKDAVSEMPVGVSRNNDNSTPTPEPDRPVFGTGLICVSVGIILLALGAVVLVATVKRKRKKGILQFNHHI